MIYEVAGAPLPAGRRLGLHARWWLLAASFALLVCRGAAAQDEPEQQAPEAPAEVAPAPTRSSQLQGRMIVAGLLMVPKQERGQLSGGFQIGAGIGWGKIPLLLGLDVGFSASGKERFRSRIEDLPDLSVEITRQDKLYFINGWLRLQPIHWPLVQPYLEGFAGTKLLQTEYSAAFVGGEGTTSTTEEKDWTRSLGWGMGLDLPLSGKEQGQATMFVMLGVRRLYSPDAVFSRTVSRGAEEILTTVRVPMDGWLISVGFAGTF